MGIAERRAREKEAIRALILKASWEIVMKDGWSSLSMRKIANAIEYSAPVIYGHFANKEAIMLELTKQGFQQLNQALKAARRKFQTPEEQIEGVAYAYLNFARTNKEYYQLMYGLGMPNCATVKEISELRDFTEIIEAPISELISKSSNKNIDPVAKLHAFWSILHGLISINRMGDENKEGLNEKVLDEFIQGFIAGISG